MSEHCIFCKIVAGDIPSQMVYRDEWVTVFRDINPAGPVHVLIVPNKHIASTNDLMPEDEAIAGRMMAVTRTIAEQEGIMDSGYRLIVNTGRDAHQVVFHLHMHLIGGAKLKHPMG